MARRRVLVVSLDRVGPRMAGPAIRSWEFARQLARDHDVTLSVPAETELEAEFAVAVADPSDHRAMWPLVASHDAVVAQFLPIETMLEAESAGTRTVYDLYDPFHLENLARPAPATVAQRLNARATELALEVALLSGDAFLCASEQQRDLWLGALGASGRLDRDRYELDPSFRELVAVVPFGVPQEPPRPNGASLKAEERDRVLLWGGGLWDWLDPLTPIRAVLKLHERRDDVRLVFLGVTHPNPLVGETEMAQRARALASGSPAVVFNEGWVPYEERGAYLLEADIGVSAHPDTVEARFAFRTRIVDYIWAGLPVVATAGDALAELARAHGFGETVAAGDVEGWVEAIGRLLDPDANARARERAAALRAGLAWPVVVEPLAKLVGVPGAPRRPSAAARLRLAEYKTIRLRLSHDHRGTAGMARHAVASVLRRLR